MKGAIVDLDQKIILQSSKFDGEQFYNPVLDNNDQYFISEEEIVQTTNPDTLWVKDLPLVEIDLRFYTII